MNEPVSAASVTRTLRLKVKAESYGWLSKAAVEVNQVFNWANATSVDAADGNRRAQAKFLSGFDLCNLSAGATEYFERIGADSIQRICCEYAAKRRAAQRVKLRWRVSRGAPLAGLGTLQGGELEAQGSLAALLRESLPCVRARAVAGGEV